MNIKKTLVGIASYALVGAVAAGVAGTWAGLQKETYAANMMMTPGLDVVMHETQRNADKTGFEKFAQCQEILPSTFAKEGVEFAWAPENEWITPSDYVAPAGADGNEWRVFDSNMQNVIDKFVTVENKGKSDAYIRTIIAYECPEGISDEYLRVNDNSARTGVITNEILGDGKLVEINGTTYWVSTYTYKEALGKGETTIPSLKQVFLRSNATTEICEAFGDTVDILVISQAAQVGDYTDATTALDAAFGDVNEENVKAWFGQYSMPTIVDSAEELTAALANGGEVVLTDDVVVDSTMTIKSGTSTTLNLNGFDLSYQVVNNKAAAIINNAGVLDIVGDGTISFKAENPDLQEIPTYATNTITNTGTLTIGEGVTVINDSDGGASYAVDNHGTFTLNGGTLIGRRCALRVAKYNTPEVYFEMNGGTVTGGTPAWIQLPGSSASAAPSITVVINDGVMQTTKATSADNDVMYTYSFGNSHANTSITINGGQFLGGTVSIGSGYKGDVPELTINGGTFEYDVLQWLENDDCKVVYSANK